MDILERVQLWQLEWRTRGEEKWIMPDQFRDTEADILSDILHECEYKQFQEYRIVSPTGERGDIIRIG